MRPQNVVLIVAAAVAGVFTLMVGFFVTWFFFMRLDEAPRVAQNFEQQMIAPMVNMQMPQEQKVANNELPRLRGETVAVEKCVVSAPKTHDNLTVFLIHGRDTVKDAKILTLQEALERNLATVHETGGGQLLVDNRSNQPLLIQGGDIVKGGTQDRTLPYDMIISPKSNRTPIPALCVEQGRSFPRAGEISTSFETATQRLPGRNLRLAATHKRQMDVWNNVRNLQDNLAQNAGGSVQAPLSRTSLQLSLEHQRVQNAVQEYLANLDPIAHDAKDAIGYVVVINGRIHSADIYASSDLFQRMWPKLIQASAVAALSEKQPGDFDAPNADAVKRFLADAENGDAFVINMGSASRVIRQESAMQVRIDTCDSARGNIVLHRAFLAK